MNAHRLRLLTATVLGLVIAMPTTPDAPALILTPPEHHTLCRASPFRVSMRSRTTPMVGRELTLDLTASTRGASGVYRLWITGLAGAAESLDGPLDWDVALESGVPVTRQVRLRVLRSDRVDLTAKLMPRQDSGINVLPGEGYLQLYPFESSAGRLVARWEGPRTGVLAPTIPGSRVITLRDGSSAVVIRGPGATLSSR